jgi:hypothetical protein
MTPLSSHLRLVPAPWIALLAATPIAFALAACGSGTDPVDSTPPASTTTTLSVTVLDGATGATACLDLNSNGVCDPDEPSTVTDAAGKASGDVPNADVGRYPVVVMVPVGAATADSGPVTTAYTLQAPADQSAVVSPLTTLGQARMATAGSTSAEAAAIVQARAGLKVSPFANYAADRATSADAEAAARLARLVVIAMQQQLASLSTVVGQADISGATVTAADLQRVVVDSLVGALPALAAAMGDQSVAAATTPAALDAALGALSTTLIANGQLGLSQETALAAIGLERLPADVPAAGQASLALRALTYTDADNWYFRANESTAADNTPDSQGLDHYYDNRTQDIAGTVTSWGINSSETRSGDLHWNGSAWVGCAFGFRSSNTPRDAQGIAQYNYCDSEEIGASQRFAVDVSGKALSEVVGTIRAFPGGDGGVAYSTFGPADMSLLGTATFPTGSSLLYQSTQATSQALSYVVLPSAIVSAYPVAIAAGGDATTTPAPACAAVSGATGATLYQPVATLEALIAASPGAACRFGSTTGSLALANEWWGNSTANLGSLAGVTTPPSTAFTTKEWLRVGFAATGNGMTYYRCLDRASDDSVRNCTSLGSGTYSIQSLGDARVLTMSDAPAEVLRLGYARLFVERGGQVHLGYQTLPGSVTPSIRLNMTAANALFGQLGLPALIPQ